LLTSIGLYPPPTSAHCLLPPTVSETMTDLVETTDNDVTSADKTDSAESSSPQAAYEDAASTGLDGGWGWMVVIGSFSIHVIIWGVAFSFGIFVEDFVDYFESSKSAVGGLGSVMIGIIYCSGNMLPLSFFLRQRIYTIQGGPKK